jgi:hypothetical protein
MCLVKSVVLLICVVGLCSAVPKKYEAQAERYRKESQNQDTVDFKRNVLPFDSSNYPENTWRRHLRDTKNETQMEGATNTYDRSGGARLGYTTGYSGLNVRI